MSTFPHIVTIRPAIFAYRAYCPWLQPAGILSIAAMLLRNNYQVTFLDFMGYGKKIPTVKVVPPLVIRHYRRPYYRYGRSVKECHAMVKALPAPPAVFFLTSGMTYWYPGVIEAVGILRKYFPKVPIVLGGTYPSLEPDHARRSGVDIVSEGEGENNSVAIASEITGLQSTFSVNARDLDGYPYPAWHLVNKMYNREFRGAWLPLYSSRGCPFSCSYCASNTTYNFGFRQRSVLSVLDEIDDCVGRLGVRGFAFNDDNLLVNRDNHIKPILEGVIRREDKRKLQFNLPNSTAANQYDPELADLMFRAGFKRVIVSIEVLNPDDQAGLQRQSFSSDVDRAIGYLRDAGFAPRQIGVYILCGLPEQTRESVIETVLYVWRAGGLPIPLTFTPIRGTPEWSRCEDLGLVDAETDPLELSKGIVACQSDQLDYTDMIKVKMWANMIRGGVYNGVNIYSGDPLMTHALEKIVQWESGGDVGTGDGSRVSATFAPGRSVSSRDVSPLKDGDGRAVRFGVHRDDHHVYSIGEVLSQVTGISLSTIKRFDDVLAPTRKNGKRCYSPAAVAAIRRVAKSKLSGKRGAALKNLLSDFLKGGGP